jgi:diguanylate cyclase (GGDEF)-like protein/PAS domain S-box-containing protein
MRATRGAVIDPAAPLPRRSRRWPTVLLACAYLVTVGCAGVLVQRSAAEGRASLEQRFDVRQIQRARFLEGFVRDTLTREAQVAQRRLDGDVDPGRFETLIKDLGFSAATLLDAQGRVLTSAPADPALVGRSLAAQYPHLARTLQGRTAVSNVMAFPAGGAPSIGFAVPFRTSGGDLRVLCAAYRVADEPLRPFLERGSLAGFRLHVIDARGALITNPEAVGRPGVRPLATLSEAEPALAAALRREQALEAAGAQISAGADQQRTGTIDVGDYRMRYAVTPIAGTQWRVIVAVPTDGLYQPLSGPGAWVPWLVVGALAVTGLLAAVTFARYRAESHRLASSRERANVILQTTPNAFIGMDAAGAVTNWNPAARDLLGWTAEEIIGAPLADVIVPSRYRQSHRDAVTRLLRTGERRLPPAPLHVQALHKDGHEIDVEVVITSAREAGAGGVDTAPAPQTVPEATQDPRDGAWRFHAFVRDLTPRLAAEQHNRVLAAIVSATNEAIFSQSVDGAIMSWNPAAERLLGHRGPAVLGAPVDLLLPTSPERRAEVSAAMRRVMAGERIESFETTLRRGDGGEVDVSLTMSPLTEPGGDVIGMSVSARDVTDAKRRAAELREAEERFRLAFDAVPTGMLLADLSPDDIGRLIRVNGSLCWLLGYTEDELRERTIFDITHPGDQETSRQLLKPFLDGLQKTIRVEQRCVRSDGSPLWVLLTSAAVHGSDNRPMYAVTQVEDITDRRTENERLLALALSDPLTGLPNRVLFDDRLGRAVQRATRLGRGVAVVYCDLDNFKPVNDRFGHATGDELLRQVGHRLLVAMRATDTVARLGGDEFAVVVEDLIDLADAQYIAERIRGAVEGTYVLSAGPVDIGVSIGVAAATGSAVDGHTLLTRADQNMFADKRQRRGDQPVPVGP